MIPQKISSAEWQVMRVIWDAYPVSAAQVVETLAPRSSWHPRTVKTLLNRLVQKGVLAFRREGKRYLYSPRVPREDCVREASVSFVGRVFGGATASAIIHMVEHAELSPEEIAELQDLLESKKKTARRPMGKSGKAAARAARRRRPR